MALGNREPGTGSPELASAFPTPGSRIPVLVVEQELIERTLALVGGQPITLSDARAAVVFGLVERRAAVRSDIPAVTGLLVDRELILREVQRYAPPAPADAAVDARLDEIRKRFRRRGRLHARPGSARLYRGAAARVDPRRLADAWPTSRSDSRRRARRPIPKISSAYARSRAEFETAGHDVRAGGAGVRERLIAARRAELIADWLSDLRRRTDVVILILRLQIQISDRICRLQIVDSQSSQVRNRIWINVSEERRSSSPLLNSEWLTIGASALRRVR